MSGNTQHDLTTPHGLLSAFDAEIDRLNTKFRWCSSGRTYPYELTGYTPDDPEMSYRIPRPQNRAGFGGNLSAVPDEFLSEAGMTAKHANDDAMLTRIREGIKTAAATAAQAGHLDVSDVNETLANLGFPALVSSETRTVGIYASVYGQVGRNTRTIKDAPDSDALIAAVQAAFPDGSVTWTTTNDRRASSGSIEVGGVNRTYTVPDPAPAAS